MFVVFIGKLAQLITELGSIHAHSTDMHKLHTHLIDTFIDAPANTATASTTAAAAGDNHDEVLLT